MTQHIALYGKGGVGKTTIAANLSAALAEAELHVLLVGCDWKADTGVLLHGYASVPTLLGHCFSGTAPSMPEIITVGYRGIACVEVGDSLGGEPCAAWSIGTALRQFRELRVVEKLAPDYVIYDLPGEVACSGLPGHGEILPPHRALVVTSGDLQSFHSSNALFRIISRRAGFLGGALVGNGITGKFEESFVEDFAHQIGTRVLLSIPRSLVVRHCELYGKTVIEAAHESNHAQVYRRLAALVAEGRQPESASSLRPLSPSQLRTWAEGWGDRLGELEFGIFRDGEGI